MKEESRKCNICNIDKHIECFSRYTNTTWHRRQCINCLSKRNKKPKVSEWRRRMKLKLISNAGGKCFDCGFSGAPFYFDFDHREPSEKSFGIALFRYGEKKTIEEVKKCDLVCTMCHRLRTHKQRCDGCEYCIVK